MKFCSFVMFFVLFHYTAGLAQDAIMLSSNAPQRLGQAGPSGGPVSLLLRMGDVHRELAIDAEQRFQLSQGMAEASRNRREFFENLVAGKVFDEPVSAKEKRSLLDLYNREGERTLLQKLTTTQVERLTQLALQLQGTEALRDKKVAVDLNLSEAQKTQIWQRLRERQSHADVLSVLTNRQQMIWQEMQGEPFAFSSLHKRIERSAKSDAAALAKRNRFRSSTRLAFE